VSKNLNMTRGKPMRLLLAFALPLMFGNIFQQLYTVVDTAIVGQGVGMEALAALGSVDWLSWMLLSIAQGFSQGFSVRISQRFGAGDEGGMRKAAAQSVLLSAVLAVVITTLGLLLLPLFMLVLRVPAELHSRASLYIRILTAGFPVTLFYNLCASILRAVGDSKTPLCAMIAASIANIGLDLIAVFVLGWGIAGAAGATVFSQVLAGAVCAQKIIRTGLLRFDRRQFAPDYRLCAELMRLGAPVAAKNVIITLGGITVQSIVNGFGVVFIAGFTATGKLYGLLEIAAISYGYAVTTYVGQNYGAGQPERIRRGMRAAVLLSLLTSALIAVLMLLLGRWITMLFISAEDPAQAAAAGNIAYRYLAIMSCSLPLLYLLYAYQSALQGLGNSVIPMVSGLVELVIRVVFSIVVGMVGAREEIFFSDTVSWFCASALLCAAYYIDMKRRFSAAPAHPLRG